MKKFIVMAVSAAVLTCTLAACQNTVHGAGADIEKAGEAVQETVPAKK